MNYQIVGSYTDGNAYVTAQSPPAGARVERESGKVLLYVGEEPEKLMTVVPNVVGMTVQQANGMLVMNKLNVRLVGSSESVSGKNSYVSVQSVAPGETVAQGTVVTLTFGSDPDENPDYSSPIQ